MVGKRASIETPLRKIRTSESPLKFLRITSSSERERISQKE